MALPEPIACDVLEWTYTQKIVKRGPRVLLAASDISSLMNNARADARDDDDEDDYEYFMQMSCRRTTPHPHCFIPVAT